MAQLSKVLKDVCWAGSVPFPPEAGCLFTVAAGERLRGEPTLFPGWLVYK